MDEKTNLAIRFGLQLVSIVALVVAVFGMVKGNQPMVTWGIIIASGINGGSILMQYRDTRKFTQLILGILLIGLCVLFVATLFMQ